MSAEGLVIGLRLQESARRRGQLEADEAGGDAAEEEEEQREAPEIDGEHVLLSPELIKEANELLETIKVKHLFFDAITSENYLNAFAYLASYPLLYETHEAQKLESNWNKVLDQALRYALKGEVEGLRKQFEFYLPISAKYASMGSVFAQCYSVQLEQKLQAHAPSSELENGIRNYVGLFGVDDYIIFFFNLYKRDYETRLDLQMIKQGSLESWTPSMLIDDITSKK